MKPKETSNKHYLNTPIYEPSFDMGFNTIESFAAIYFPGTVSIPEGTAKLATDAVNSGLNIGEVLQALKGSEQYNDFGQEHTTLLDETSAKKAIERLKNKGVVHLNKDELLIVKEALESQLDQYQVLGPIALDLSYTVDKIDACAVFDYPVNHQYKNIFDRDELSTVYDGLSNCIAQNLTSQQDTMLSIMGKIEYAHPDITAKPKKTIKYISSV